MNIIKLLPVCIFLLCGVSSAQNSLIYYLEQGSNNAPSLSEFKNLKEINAIQSDLNSAENSSFNIFLSADYLFAPYFNNNGNLISTNPGPNAIGYDIGITNGGWYSAQLNIEKNIFNSGLLEALQNQNLVQSEQYSYTYVLEKHNLQKQITDQYLTAYKSLRLYYLSKEIVSNLSEQLNIASDMVEQGFLTAQNYLLMRIELENEKANMNVSMQSYKNDLTQLNTLCGIGDTAIVFLDSTELQQSEPKYSSDFIKKYELDSLAINNQQNVFETKYLPQLKLFFNTGLNAVELNGIERRFGLSAGLSFSLPIFDGGQKSFTRQQNEISLKTIQEYKNYFTVNLALMLNNSQTKINSLKQNLNSLNSQLADYQKLMDLSMHDLQKGDISMIEFLVLLKNFVDMKKSKIEKEIDYQMEINNYNYWNW